MCFKTAGLAPVAKKAGKTPEPVVKVIETSASSAQVHYTKAQDEVRLVAIKFGNKVNRAFKAGDTGSGEDAQYVGPDDLRQLAKEFNKLAKKLEA